MFRRIKNLEFSILNFKSINHNKFMKLKPITIFCGTNSSGKSSILQSQLLISQSFKRQYISKFEESQKTPQIFIFEGNKCHLLDYKNIIYENNLQNKLEYCWKFKKTSNFIKIHIKCGYMQEESPITKGFPVVENIIIKKIRRKIAQSIELTLLKDNFNYYELNLSNFNFKFNEFRFGRYYYLPSFFHFLPIQEEITVLDIINDLLKKFNPEIKIENLKKNFNQFSISDIKFNQVKLDFQSIFPIKLKIGDTKFKTLRLSDKFKDFFDIDKFNKKYKRILKKKPIIEDLEEGLIKSLLKTLSWSIESFIYDAIEELLNIYGNIMYLGPLREDPKRFYMFSDLRLLDIGLKGENTTQVLTIQNNMMIDYIDIKQINNEIVFSEISKLTLLDALNKWLKKMNLQTIKPTRKLELISQLLVSYSKFQPKDSSVSLPDVGFGLSQILPVLVEVLRMQPNDLLILEQPEIHLHPRMQGDLADFILSNAQLKKNFIIETHSENFLKKLCLRIAQFKHIDLSKIISIYFIVPNSNGRGAKIIDVEMDEFGSIKNWPQGFFDENLDGLLLEASMNKMKFNKGKE